MTKSIGGTLNVLKCFFQVINYHFAQNRSTVVAPIDPDLFINITDNSDDLTQTVQAISAYTPYKSLGMIQGIYRKQDDHLK